MARKPNQSSGLVNRLQELESRFKQRMDLPTGAESDILERIGAANQNIDALASAPNGAQTAEDITGQMQEIERLYRQLAPLEKGREVGATRSYISSMGSALRAGNLSREVNSMASSSSSLIAATGMTSTPTYQLEQMRNSAMAAMNAAAGNINASVINNPQGGLNTTALGALGSSVSAAAEAQAALTMQRRMGLDINSRYMNTRDANENISKYLAQKDLAANVAAGKMGSRADVESSLRSDMSKIEGFQSAQARHAGDPEKFERFQRAIDKLTESASKAASTLREMDRQNIGGGNFFNNPKVAAGLNLIQQGAQIGGAITDMWTFNNPIRERQNQSAFGNLANAQFNDSLGALSGDMSALRRLGGTYGAAQSANSSAQTGSKVSSGFGLVGGIAGALLAGSALTAATGAGIPIAAVMAAAGGSLLAVNHFAGNFNQQAGERGAAMAQAEIARQNALAHINDSSAQAYRDYSATGAEATVGLGSQRGWNFDVMNSTGAVRQFARVGLNTQRAAQLTALGVQSSGGEFNTNQLIRSGQARQAGIMREEQYLQTVGNLSNFGGNADSNWQEALKNAVANGVDNAKSLAAIGQGIATMASRTAGAGIDTLAGSRMISSRMQDLMGDQGIPMNMRGAVAQNSQNYLDRTLGDTSLNLYSLGRFSNVQRSFRGASMAQLEVMSTLSAEETAQLSGPNGEDYANKIGIRSQLVDKDGKFDPSKVKLLQTFQFEQVANSLSRYGRSEGLRKGLLSAGSVEEFLANASPEDREAFANTQRLERVNLGTTLGAVSGTGARSGVIGTGNQGGAGEMDKQAVAAAEGNARLVEQGRDIIEALGGLKGLTEALNSVASKFNPQEMSQGVQKAAESFKIPVKDFGDAVKQFSYKIDQMNGKR